MKTAFLFASQEGDFNRRGRFVGSFTPAASAFGRILRARGYQRPVVNSFEVNNIDDDHERDAIRQMVQASANKFDLVAYFGHGGSSSLISADMSAHEFCTLFQDRLNPGAIILLFACSAGSPGGFAAQVSRFFSKRIRDITITGHTTAEDATRNPAVTQYPDPHPNSNDFYIVHPNSALWPTWVRKISDTSQLYWAAFPFQTLDGIARDLYAHAWQNHTTLVTDAQRYQEREYASNSTAAGRLYRIFNQKSIRAMRAVRHSSESNSDFNTEANRRILADQTLQQALSLSQFIDQYGSNPPIDQVLRLMRPF